MSNPQDELFPPPSEDDELTLPRASINKIIKELVPSVRVANQSRELLLNCCSEFIDLISSEANEVCNMRNNKTINAEHVLEALERLGFRDYKQEAEAVLNDCKEVNNKLFFSEMSNPQDELCPPPSEDDELTLPRASINKIIKELVPSVRVANESRELLLNCCSEFIHLISSEANEVCNMRNKKTINAEHVLEALERLGFRDYKQEAEAVLNDCKEVAAKRRRQSTRLENLGIPEEELLRQQQELFEKAREEQAQEEQQQWISMQASAIQQSARQMRAAGGEEDEEDDDEY